MNRKQCSVVLASVLALALAGCSSTGGGSDTGAGGGSMGSGTSGTGGSTGSGASAPSGGAATEGAGSGGTAATGGAGAATPQSGQMPPSSGGAMGSQTAMPNAVVTVIEVVPHPDGSAAVGGSGTAGTTGSSASRDKMYRITLRMDDGTTRVVTQDKAPTFRNGDRVNMTDGMITQ